MAYQQAVNKSADDQANTWCSIGWVGVRWGVWGCDECMEGMGGTSYVTIDYLGVKTEAIYETISYPLTVSSITTWVSRGTVSSLTSVLSTWTPPTSQHGQTWAASMSLLHSLRECNIEYPFN